MASKVIHEAIFKISGKTDKSLSSAFKAAEKAALGASKAVGSKIKDIGAVVGKATLAVGAAVTGASIAAGKALVDIGTEFDKASDAIRIGTGATGEALKALNADFDAVYSAVPTTMEDASQAIADYNTRLGLTGEPLRQISEQAIQVANLLGDDLGSVIEESSQAFQQWGIDAAEMVGAMDYIFKASQSTGMGFTDLMSNIQSFGPQMQELGFSFEETAALLGQLDKAGVNSTEVMGALKKSVATMAKEGMSASEGLEYYTRAIQEAGSAQEATAIAAGVFGSRAGSTMAAAIREGSLSVGDLTAALRESDETIMKAAEDTMDFPERLQLLKQKAQVALRPVANSLFDQLNNAMPAVEQVMDATLPAIEAIGKKAGAAFEAAMPFVTGAVGRAADYIGQELPALLDGAGQLGEVVMPVLQQAGGAFQQYVLPLIDQMKPFIAVILQKILEIVPLIGSAIAAVMPVLSEILGNVLPNITGAIGGVLDVIKGVLNFITNVFTGNWEAAWQNIKDIVAGIFSTFANVIAAPINAAITTINKVIGAINGALGEIQIPDWVPIFGGKTFGINIPEIPMLAQGGTVASPTLAVIGEAGAETVVPHNNSPRSRALLREAWEGVYGRGSQTTNNITFAPNIYGSNAEEVAELTMAKFKQFMEQYRRDESREAWA